MARRLGVGGVGVIRLSLLLLLATGCAAAAPAQVEPELMPLDAEIQVSDAFRGEERAQIDGAAADWYRATGGSVRFELVRRAGDGPWRVERGPTAKGMGETIPWERRITINADGITPPDGQPFRADEFRGLTLHELGHALGLEHGDGALMEPFVGTCIDEATLNAFCERRGCAEFSPTCSE
jgi:hypothetical protein